MTPSLPGRPLTNVSHFELIYRMLVVQEAFSLNPLWNSNKTQQKIQLYMSALSLRALCCSFRCIANLVQRKWFWLKMLHSIILVIFSIFR